MRKSALMLIFICGFLFVGCKGSVKQQRPAGPPKSDVDFARDGVQMMIDGKPDVADMIDWENLQIFGGDVGTQYRAMSSDSARASFRTSFLRGYADSFKSSNANNLVMKNWREQSKNDLSTVVAGDAPNGRTLLITVTHTNGQQNISSIQVK